MTYLWQSIIVRQSLVTDKYFPCFFKSQIAPPIHFNIIIVPSFHCLLRDLLNKGIILQPANVNKAKVNSETAIMQLIKPMVPLTPGAVSEKSRFLKSTYKRALCDKLMLNYPVRISLKKTRRDIKSCMHGEAIQSPLII